MANIFAEQHMPDRNTNVSNSHLFGRRTCLHFKYSPVVGRGHTTWRFALNRGRERSRVGDDNAAAESGQKNIMRKMWMKGIIDRQNRLLIANSSPQMVGYSAPSPHHPHQPAAAILQQHFSIDYNSADSAIYYSLILSAFPTSHAEHLPLFSISEAR